MGDYCCRICLLIPKANKGRWWRRNIPALWRFAPLNTLGGTTVTWVWCQTFLNLFPPCFCPMHMVPVKCGVSPYEQDLWYSRLCGQRSTGTGPCQELPLWGWSTLRTYTTPTAERFIWFVKLQNHNNCIVLYQVKVSGEGSEFYLWNKPILTNCF